MSSQNKVKDIRTFEAISTISQPIADATHEISEMNKQVVDVEREKKILGRMPLHRYGEPEELASKVLFLVSPAATI